MHPFSPLKTWENQRFSDVFRGVEEGALGTNELNEVKDVYLDVFELPMQPK